MKKLVTICAVIAMASSVALSAIGHFEGFEDPVWSAGTYENWNNGTGGDIVRVASGTSGITSKSGNGHGRITNLSMQYNVFNVLSLGADSPYTRLGGYSSVFNNGFTAKLDVYLDTTWDEGDGFDYGVAINNNLGNHMRDYVFHVGVTDLGLLVNASNNTDCSFNDYKLENENSGNYGTITATGWYTLEHMFYDNSGTVSVNMSLLDSLGNTVWNATRTSSDAVADAGGNRYAWMDYCNIDGLAIDNTQVVPEPATIAILCLGGLLLGRKK